MKKDPVKEAMKIPKRHSLRYYINLVGKLYAEDEAFLKEYADDIIQRNDENLDAAISCFQGLIKPAEHARIREEEERQKRLTNAYPNHRGSLLKPISTEKKE